MNTMNLPNEQVVLAKDDAYVEFAWNPSERGVRVTQALGPNDIEWDRLHTINMSRPDAREHWIEYKRLGYRRQSIGALRTSLRAS